MSDTNNGSTCMLARIGGSNSAKMFLSAVLVYFRSRMRTQKLELKLWQTQPMSFLAEAKAADEILVVDRLARPVFRIPLSTHSGCVEKKGSGAFAELAVAS